MKQFLIVLTVFICGFRASAQSPEDSVKSVINTMFTAMKNADVATLKSCFTDSVIFQTIRRDGKVVNEDVNEFLDNISRETPGNADERIRFDVVKTDGPLAIAWTPYEFYYKGKYSHCGVDSYQLVRVNGEWKIQYLIDTRRKECQ